MKNDVLKKIYAISKTIPANMAPDDQTLAVLLVDLLCEHEAQLPQEATATMYGIAAALMQRMPMPAKQFVDAGGQAVYTVQQVAEHLNLPVHEVMAMAEDLAKQHPEDFTAIDPADLTRVQ